MADMKLSAGQSLLVVGGCRSGKSSFAQQVADNGFIAKTYLATMRRSSDLELKSRIDFHQQDRGNDWQTIEEPLDLDSVISSFKVEDGVLLIDCLTMWLTNLLLDGRLDSEIEQKMDELVVSIGNCQGALILVANEVGMGVVPTDSLARRFRDLAGLLNQRVAACCHQVVLVAAGLPLILK